MSLVGGGWLYNIMFASINWFALNNNNNKVCIHFLSPFFYCLSIKHYIQFQTYPAYFFYFVVVVYKQIWLQLTKKLEISHSLELRYENNYSYYYCYCYTGTYTMPISFVCGYIFCLTSQIDQLPFIDDFVMIVLLLLLFLNYSLLYICLFISKCLLLLFFFLTNNLIS